MNEKLLQYIWKHQLFDKRNLKSVADERLIIESCGQHNPDSGPDFINARVKIDDTLWVGNIEVHLSSADWYNHNHHLDNSYNNVILHVVYRHDRDVMYSNGQKIPTLVLKTSKLLLENYALLMQSEHWVPCQSRIKLVDSVYINNWLMGLAFERLQHKSESILNILKHTNNDWEQTLFILLSRSFGAKINADPFERLAKSIPIRLVSKYKFNKHQIEALFFGQAGYLNEDIEGDKYHQSLKAEYNFLKKKHALESIEIFNWKFLRVRPSGFPTVRIAQLAALYIDSNHLFSKIIDTHNLQGFYKLLTNTISDYWLQHYQFGKETRRKTKNMTRGTLDILLINAVLPILFTYGKYKGLSEIQEKVLELFEQLKSETNRITRNWDRIGIKSQNALQSQALLQLKDRYCNYKRCLECPVGLKVMT